MKKTHLTLLIITAIMALFSAYSLAAMNQVYMIGFEWYSQYNNQYMGEYRETDRDRWQLGNYPEHMRFDIAGNDREFAMLKSKYSFSESKAFNPEVDFDKYILMGCTLGDVYSPEYRVKIIDIAQRGNVVEIKVSVSSPAKIGEMSSSSEYRYTPMDIVRIDKAAFPEKGKLCFIFKNQDGSPLFETYYDVE